MSFRTRSRKNPRRGLGEFPENPPTNLGRIAGEILVELMMASERLTFLLLLPCLVWPYLVTRLFIYFCCCCQSIPGESGWEYLKNPWRIRGIFSGSSEILRTGNKPHPSFLPARGSLPTRSVWIPQLHFQPSRKNQQTSHLVRISRIFADWQEVWPGMPSWRCSSLQIHAHTPQQQQQKTKQWKGSLWKSKNTKETHTHKKNCQREEDNSNRIFISSNNNNKKNIIPDSTNKSLSLKNPDLERCLERTLARRIPLAGGETHRNST